MWNVPHLVRDCEQFKAARESAWCGAAAFAIGAGVMAAEQRTASAVCASRHDWYLLTLGAAVPVAFCRVAAGEPTHFARVRGGGSSTVAPQQRERDAMTYRQLLHITGTFLDDVMQSCVTAVAQWAQSNAVASGDGVGGAGGAPESEGE